MKKAFLSKLLIALMLVNVFTISLMTFSKQNAAYAVTSEEEEEEGDIEWGTVAALAGAGVALIKGLFCPTNPQNRCKNNVCMSGACISLRPPCAGTSSCGNSNAS